MTIIFFSRWIIMFKESKCKQQVDMTLGDAVLCR
jgi:hypothetical protein